jgi:uncharacterized ion transporter superfamily protein YfcC
MAEDKEGKEEEKGLVRMMTEVFVEKMKELKPIEASLIFFGLVITGTFGVIGFTSAIATGVVKLVQVVGQAVASGGLM